MKKTVKSARSSENVFWPKIMKNIINEVNYSTALVFGNLTETKLSN